MTSFTLWETVKSNLDQGGIGCTSTKRSSNLKEVQEKGGSGHAFAILETMEIPNPNSRGNPFKLLKIMNPWGSQKEHNEDRYQGIERKIKLDPILLNQRADISDQSAGFFYI